MKSDIELYSRKKIAKMKLFPYIEGMMQYIDQTLLDDKRMLKYIHQTSLDNKRMLKHIHHLFGLSKKYKGEREKIRRRPKNH